MASAQPCQTLYYPGGIPAPYEEPEHRRSEIGGPKMVTWQQQQRMAATAEMKNTLASLQVSCGQAFVMHAKPDIGLHSNMRMCMCVPVQLPGCAEAAWRHTLLNDILVKVNVLSRGAAGASAVSQCCESTVAATAFSFLQSLVHL